MAEAVLADAAELARRWAGPALAPAVPLLSRLEDLLRQLAAAEQEADAARTRLSGLLPYGAVSDRDRADYNALRKALLKAQQALHGELARVLLSIPGGRTALAQIPTPVAMPALGFGSTIRLGNPAAAAPAAGAAAPLAMSPWFWAAACLAILVTLGLLAVIAFSIASSAAAVATVGIAKLYADLLSETAERRLATFQECVAAGTDPVDCARLAMELVPTPADGLPELPDLFGWMPRSLMWGAIALGVGVAGYFGYEWWKRKKR